MSDAFTRATFIRVYPTIFSKPVTDYIEMKKSKGKFFKDLYEKTKDYYYNRLFVNRKPFEKLPSNYGRNVKTLFDLKKEVVGYVSKEIINKSHFVLNYDLSGVGYIKSINKIYDLHKEILLLILEREKKKKLIEKKNITMFDVMRRNISYQEIVSRGKGRKSFNE